MKSFRLLAAVLCIFMLSSCSTTVEKGLKEENFQLKAQLSALEAQIAELNTKYSALEGSNKNEMHIPSIMYSSYEEQKRLVLKKVPMRVYPGGDLPIVDYIEPNTAVRVLDAAMVDGQDMWLYVEKPVYDIPAHYKGWVKEADTLQLTEINKKQAFDSVTIKKGTSIYNCSEFELITETKPEKPDYDLSGRVEEIKQGYARIFSAGGWYYWVKEDAVIYAYDTP